MFIAAAPAVCRGKGKMRNRRYTLRKGPLVVFGSDHGISKAFRNLPGAIIHLNIQDLSVLDLLFTLHSSMLVKNTVKHLIRESNNLPVVLSTLPNPHLLRAYCRYNCVSMALKWQSNTCQV